MPFADSRTGLHQIARDTWAYLQPPGTWGWSNAGLVVGDREALLVDTAYTLDLTRQLKADIAANAGTVPIKTVVATHGNGDHYNGVGEFPGAEVICSQATGDELHTEIPPAAMTAMTEQTEPQSALGAYMRTYFHAFDWDGVSPPPPTRTFAGRLELEVSGRDVVLTQAGPAHSDGDTFVHVPDSGVLFAGDLVFTGDHPVMWAGPWRNWVQACDLMLGTGAQIIVPGHGPVTDPEGLKIFRGYLEHVGDWAERQFHAGTPYDVAAVTMPMSGYSEWGLPERLVITVGTIYSGLGQPVAGGRETLIGRMAQHWHALRQ